MKINTRPFAIIGILLFIYILSKTGINNIIITLSKANTSYILAGIFIGGLTIIFKTLKWKYILSSQNIRLSFKETMKIWIIGSFAGLITPGHGGEIIKIYYLKDRYKSGIILSTIAIDRISDILGLFVLSIIGISLLFIFFKINLIIVIFMIVAATAFVYIIAKENITRAIAKPVYKRLIPEAKKRTAKQSYNSFFKSIKDFKKNRKVSSITLAISIFIWSTGVVQAYFLIHSLGLEIPITYIFSITPLSTLVTILPITIAGIGTREATIIYFFSIVNITATDAVSYSLLDFGVLILITFIGGIVWLTDKKKLKI